MAQNQGTLVGAAIRPADSADNFASAFQNEIKGGHHSVLNVAGRNAIPVERREFGMLCWVSEDGKDYRLCNSDNGGVDDAIENNENWIEKGGVALGETASTAYRGDRGKIAYDHSQATGNPHSTTAAQVGAYTKLEVGEIADQKQVKDLVYDTIAEMLLDQANQLENQTIRVNNATADTNLIFPTGANKVAYYKYDGVAGSPASIADYTLLSAPYSIIVNTDRRITTSSIITKADFGKTIYVSGTAIELAIDVSVNMLNDSFKCFFHNLNAVDSVTFTFEPLAGWTFPTSLTLYAGEECALVRVKDEQILKLLGNG